MGAFTLVSHMLVRTLLDKGDSRPRHLKRKGCKHCLVRQTWPFSLFGPM